MGWATFWAILSQTHLVTLIWASTSLSYVAEICYKTLPPMWDHELDWNKE
jgi:hypothetical protein